MLNMLAEAEGGGVSWVGQQEPAQISSSVLVVVTPLPPLFSFGFFLLQLGPVFPAKDLLQVRMSNSDQPWLTARV